MDNPFLNINDALRKIQNDLVVLNNKIDSFVNSNKKQFLSPKEFAKILNHNYKTIIRRCKIGEIKGHQDKPNGNWSIPISELDRFKKNFDL
jgi:hypothetical protein